MNTTRIIARPNAANRGTELEIMAPHGQLSAEGLAHSLMRLGIGASRITKLSTPRYRVIRTTLAELDGSELGATRMTQVMSAVRTWVGERTPSRPYRRAA